MKTPIKFVIVAALVVLVAGAVLLKQGRQAAGPANIDPPGVQGAVGLPRLLDLGADKCIPCKMMAPVLEELKRDYTGRLQVDFIDVWKNERAAETHKVQTIPTQIFYDPSGKELWRHEGFISRQDILAKWKELGVALDGNR